MQKPMEVEEIAEAIKLLEDFDESLPSTERLNNFKLGIELLKEYLADNPDSPHAQFVQNKKIAHTRRILKFLRSIDSTRFANWISVVVALFESIQEIEQLSKQDESLKFEYENFLSKWKNTSELKEVINALQLTEKK